MILVHSDYQVTTGGDNAIIRQSNSALLPSRTLVLCGRRTIRGAASRRSENSKINESHGVTQEQTPETIVNFVFLSTIPTQRTPPCCSTKSDSSVHAGLEYTNNRSVRQSLVEAK